MEENINVFDFVLDDEDIMEIMSLDNSESMSFDFRDPEMVEWFDEMVEVRKNQKRADLEEKKW